MKSFRTAATLGVLAAVYFGAAKFGLTLAFVHASATEVWPPTGISLAAVLLVGYRSGASVLRRLLNILAISNVIPVHPSVDDAMTDTS